MTARSPGHVLFALVLPALLGGCITVLPAEKPVALYRLTPVPPTPRTTPTPTAAFSLRLAPITFEPSSSGDRILTFKGDQGAYIRGARWVAPAAEQFEAASVAAFQDRDGPVRLISPGSAAAVPDLVLKLTVRGFDIRRDGAAPKAVVSVYATLSKPLTLDDRKVRLFRVEIPAESDTVHAMVAAFGKATGAILSQIADWTERRGG